MFFFFFNHFPAAFRENATILVSNFLFYSVIRHCRIEKNTYILIDYMVNTLYKLSFVKCHRLTQVSVVRFDNLVLTFTAFPICQFIYGCQFQCCLQHINSVFEAAHTSIPLLPSPSLLDTVKTQLLFLNAVYFNAVHLLCSALILTRAALSQISYCHRRGIRLSCTWRPCDVDRQPDQSRRVPTSQQQLQ